MTKRLSRIERTLREENKKIESIIWYFNLHFKWIIKMNILTALWSKKHELYFHRCYVKYNKRFIFFVPYHMLVCVMDMLCTNNFSRNVSLYYLKVWQKCLRYFRGTISYFLCTKLYKFNFELFYNKRFR